MNPMTANARRLKNNLDGCIGRSPVVDINWSEGSLLVIDNHRMLHARGKAIRNDPDRVLKRILIKERT